MKKLFVVMICCLGLGRSADAQLLNANYQTSIPLGKVNDFTNKASFRGFDIGYQHLLGERFSVGAAVGWNVFYKSENDATGDFSFQHDNIVYTITGKQYRYINTVPILAVGRYYFTGYEPGKAWRPYIGLGIGTSWTEKRLELGRYASTISRWQFALSPEAGTYVYLSPQFGLNFGVKYNYSTKAASGKVPEFQSVAFSIGVVLHGQERPEGME